MNKKEITVSTSLSFEMNLDLDVAEREVYSALDWIRSLGGF